MAGLPSIERGIMQRMAEPEKAQDEEAVERRLEVRLDDLAARLSRLEKLLEHRGPS